MSNSLSLNKLSELFDKLNLDKDAPIYIMGAPINHIWTNPDGSITIDESPCAASELDLEIKY